MPKRSRPARTFARRLAIVPLLFAFITLLLGASCKDAPPSLRHGRAFGADITTSPPTEPYF
ncbi:MAG TPA: hypothetical protein VLS89_07880, partial [Candidatus Nanopelagicales bacterium]|nr:hypothetical protein [Candidatus Nanopelagicales bacterium]